MPEETPGQRLRLAMEMYEFGVRMQRTRIRRNRPEATEDEIDEAVNEWLLTRPGAPLGDAVGRPSSRFA
ncbi:hypothetical protein [Nocardia amamiensis]|uniref:hypothetical protein n=1 Tax=Nocardia amamiensis TaxID=404578 RepID=UPI000A79FA15|nr:hypothetical protein [Nocardia amamiensis]